jgi:hypothetical protein
MAAGDFYVNIENIIGSTLGNDVLLGNSSSNSIVGGAGNDTIGGGGGGDFLDGGAGTNTLTYAWESVGVTIYLGGTDQTGPISKMLSAPHKPTPSTATATTESSTATVATTPSTVSAATTPSSAARAASTSTAAPAST